MSNSNPNSRYVGYNNNKNNSFSVTSSRDGSRSFNGNDRWRRSNSGRGPKNRGSRGNMRGGFRNFNSNSSRYRNRPGTGSDIDGDISMSGDSYQYRSRDRFRDRGSRGRGHGKDRRGQLHKGERWFKVMVPFGARMSQEDLYALIRSGSEGTPFNPVSYHTFDQRALFFVKGYEEAEHLRVLSRRITKPDNHKLVMHVTPSDPPQKSASVSEEDKEKLKLSGLDLSGNKMLSLGHMIGLVKGAPGVTSLNLGQNQIRSVEELEKLKDWSNIVELVLEGNNLCSNFKNKMEYVSAVRKKMPKVVKLDGNDLPPPVSFSLDTQTLPPSKGSYFLEEKCKNLIVTFVKEYYSIYDSDSRRNLMAAYSESAQFSFCVLRNPTIDKQGGFKTYIRESRNLKRIGHIDSDEKAKKIKTGTLAIVSALESLPKTTHDVNSFTVDVTLATPAALCFVLHGLFKESENQADKPIIRSFSRTFVTIPKGNGISIINDMLTISNAGIEQSMNAFKGSAPTPSSSPASGSQAEGAAITDTASSSHGHALTDQQKTMVKSFAAESGMNMQFSLNCLLENAWNYQQAGQIFLNLKNQGKIPPEAFINTI